MSREEAKMTPKLSVVPAPPYNPEDVIVYNEQYLASLSDSALAVHLVTDIVECGEECDSTKRLQAEADRRGLTQKQISEFYFVGSTDR